MIAVIAAAGALAALAFALSRLLLGPSLLDRAAAAHAVLALSVALCAAFAAASGQAGFVDVALALIGVEVVFALVVLKAARRRSFQPALAALAPSQPLAAARPEAGVVGAGGAGAAP